MCKSYHTFPQFTKHFHRTLKLTGTNLSPPHLSFICATMNVAIKLKCFQPINCCLSIKLRSAYEARIGHKLYFIKTKTKTKPHEASS